MPETQARRALAGVPILFSVLAPVGSYAGRGRLRVLRARPMRGGAGTELVCGYEAYERLDSR